MENIPALMGNFLQYVVAFTVFCAVLQLVFCYAIQVIADKQDVPASWLAWVPLLQIYPIVKSGDGSFAQLLVILLSAVAVGIASVLLTPLLGPVIGGGLMLGWGVWASVYFGRLLWNTAVNRGVSGWWGLLVFVPLLGLFAYFHIAFHDGLAPPSKVGLVLGLLLYVAPLVPALRGEGELAQMAQLGEALKAGDEQAAAEVLARISAAQGQPIDRAQLEEMMHGLSAGLEEAGAAAGAEVRIHPTGFHAEAGFPVDDTFLCPDGSTERGAAPPAGFERWCELETPLGTERHGSYAAWHPNGQPREIGSYLNGNRDGLWTRFHRSGGRRAQAQFQDGVQHGLLITWDEFGRKQREIQFRDGQPES